MGDGNNRDPLKEVILRAWSDPDFKSKLMSDPSNTLAEFGISSGKPDQELRIVENDENSTYFVLPAKPELDGLSSEKISEMIDSVMAVQLVLPTILGD